MRNFIKYLMVGLLLGVVFPAMGHLGPKQQGSQTNTVSSATLRSDCDVAQAAIDQSLNNVRTTLLTGGDVWWDGTNARYIVPKVDEESGLPEVSSIFAGAVWLGGIDEGGNLKIACQQYGTGSGNTDFWPGPLTEFGTTSKDTCADWDEFFQVTAEEIDQHLANYAVASTSGQDYDPETIPDGVRFWPARGNPFFNDTGGYDFELPGNEQGLAGFHDADANGLYDPTEGDYPIIEIRGCPDIYYPDEMTFWIYNDAGNTHTETGSETPIRMEVQVQAFAYKTGDEVNDMTFMRYKLINRAIETIDSTYFAMWVDPDLGCYVDDYIGCDTSRSLMYIYNQDATDGDPGFTCPGGVNTYGDETPLLGVDYFRGPIAPKVFFGPDSILINPAPMQEPDTLLELGMSSFTYFNGLGATQGTGDPVTASQYYNYLSGTWVDDLPFTVGGDGHNPGNPQVTKFAFPSPPDEIGGWSMAQEGLPAGDRRTVQASGPFRLEPGAVNELIVGVVWVPNIASPAPDIIDLLAADDVAQALFDNCFVLPNGPDAPNIDWVELDREIVAVFTNDSLLSNNAFELYEENDLRFSGVDNDDSTYVFEGYKLFQLAAADVNVSELDDPDRARLVAQVDVRNNVLDLYNWTAVPNPTADVTGGPAGLWVPELKVENANNDGAKHLFKITEDLFATSDRQLVNHKKYYFVAVAYGFNEHTPFNPDIPLFGQRSPYIQGRRNIGDKIAGTDYYTVIPRPIIDRTLNADFGDGPEITRLDGRGVGQNFIRLTEESEKAILDGTDDGKVTYQGGSGPIGVVIYNPLDLKEADFDVRIVDSNLDDNIIDEDANWVLREFDEDGTVINTVESERDISYFNEQILAEYGFALTFSQTDLVGDKEDDSNGLIGIETSYEEAETNQWYSSVPENSGFPGFYNFIKTDPNEGDEFLDPTQSLSSIGNGDWKPYTLCDWKPQIVGDPRMITPAWLNTNSDIVRSGNPLDSLNNVDIVFTSNKDNWSRCVVVETANNFYLTAALPGTDDRVETEGGAVNFDVRQSPSVDKEGKDDGSGTIGMGWFPGYAIDPETGERLNIFFGENSLISCEEPQIYSNVCDRGGFQEDPTGRDMIWNPTSQRFVDAGLNNFGILNIMDGGQHFIYVTREQYDECAKIHANILDGDPIKRVKELRKVTWTSFPILPEGVSLLPVSEGLIPNDYKVSLRVDRPYVRDQQPKYKDGDNMDAYEDFTGTGINNRYPTYSFSTEGLAATELDEDGIDTALDMINVVPNPYYGFSSYETTQFTNVVKVTNLPAKCTVTIFSLDGKFIRQYKRDAQGVPTNTRNNPALDISQYTPDVEWDLKNSKNIPVASGVYLIHIDAGDMGERVIKWFGVARQFDPSGL